MLNLKKTAVAVLALGSSAVFAGTMGPVCTPGSVTVPCANTAWDFGAKALYLQSTYAGVGFNGSNPRASATNVVDYNQTPNNWGWGFEIEGSYHYNTGNDINLNWYHLDNKHSGSAATLTVPGYLPADLTAGVALSNAAYSAKPNWDAVNLEFGQVARFGELTNIRFHGGFEYAYIQDTLTLSGTRTSTGAAVVNNASLKYSGFGPRIGADYGYGWGNGFGVYANGAVSLLAGTQTFGNNLTVGTTAYGANGSAAQIVPELETKVGATYTYAMAQGDLSLDLGWMWVNYFNALAKGTVLGYGDVRSTSFGVQGPFVGLKWVGNVV